MSAGARGAAVCAALAGCAPSVPADLGGHRSYAFVALGPGDAAVEVRATDGDPAGFVGALDRGRRYRAFGYDHSLAELQLAVDARGVVAMDEAGWPLPPPSSAHELDEELSVGPLELATGKTWSATVRVAPPPCYPQASPIDVRGFPQGADVRFALPFAGAALVGLSDGHGASGGPPTGPRVVRVSGEGQVEALEGLVFPDGVPVPAQPYASVAGDEAWVLFPRTSTEAFVQYELLRVGADGGIRERLRPGYDPRLLPAATASAGVVLVRELARVQETGRIVARATTSFVRGDVFLGGSDSFLVALDAPELRWVPLERRPTTVTSCKASAELHAFAVERDGRVLTAHAERTLGLAEVSGSSARWEDLHLGAEAVCRSARVMLPGELEVVVVEADGTFEAQQLAWRVGDGPWSSRAEVGLEARGIGAIPGGFAAGGNDASLILFRFSAARADIGPVRCGKVELQQRLSAVAAISDTRLFVGGLGPRGPDGEETDGSVGQLIDVSEFR